MFETHAPRSRIIGELAAFLDAIENGRVLENQRCASKRPPMDIDDLVDGLNPQITGQSCIDQAIVMVAVSGFGFAVETNVDLDE